MIYDCFTFFNELDLLEIRLNTLDKVVDKFVLVEATKTFSNLDKPLYFEQNKKRFEKFLPKIIHVIVDDFPTFSNAWDYEYFQRNAIERGLANVKSEDIILISDVDEIPNSKKIKNFNGKGISVFEQRMFYYYFNNINLYNPFWIGTRVLTYEKMVNKKLSPQKIRQTFGNVIFNGGWHFSYLGGAENISQKIKSFSHQEYNTDDYTNVDKILDNIENGRDLFNRGDKYIFVGIDNSFPQYLINKKEFYKKNIRDKNISNIEKIILMKNKIYFHVKFFIKSKIK